MSTIRLVILLVLCAALVPAPQLTNAHTALAQSSPPALRSSPTSLTATVPLGETRDVTLTLDNLSDTPQLSRLFEAFPPPQMAKRSVVAPELRRVALPQQASKVDAQIRRDIAAAPDQTSDFLVFLAEQPDLSAAYAMTNWRERGEFVYQTLFNQAEQNQRDIRSWLDSQGVAYKPLWITNALLVNGSERDVTALAARSDVALLRANRVASIAPSATNVPTLLPASRLQAPQAQLFSCRPNDANICWNIVDIGADRVWADFGVRGGGVTVANIDSGVKFDHKALVAQYRGNRGDGVFEHNYNWFDPISYAPVPEDAGDHGTHTMGTMVARGDESEQQPAVGVAPDAQWVAARGCSATQCREADLILAAQWLIAPTDVDGENPRPDLRPQIVNNSWAEAEGANKWYAGYVAAWRAAGIFPVFAAGNNGNLSGCGSIQSPGDYPDVVAVGATGTDRRVATFSSVGPTEDGRIKPDLTAPGGSGIVSTFSNDTLSYGTLNGTSMAAPHVAGAVALLWSANPALIGDYDATYALLINNTKPRTTDARFTPESHADCTVDSEPNNVYGYGNLDVYAAVAAASIDVPWLGLPTPQTATIAPNSSPDFTITLDARHVPGPGRYEARVVVHGADLGDTPLSVPVVMNVPSDPSHVVVGGRVTTTRDGSPLAATVAINNGPAVTTTYTGDYTVTLPAGTAPYTLTASAVGYAAASATVTDTANTSVTLDFTLRPDIPQLATVAMPYTATLSYEESTATLTALLGNTGTKELSYTLELPNASFGVWRSDQIDGVAYRWFEPPANAITLDLGDDGASDAVPIGFNFPFYGKHYNELFVGANGMVAFTPITSFGANFLGGCLPASETIGAAIAPLRVDLNPADAGSRISYAPIPEGFLITYADVPLFSDPNQRFTFQMLLAPDGTVLMNYQQVGLLLAREGAAIGVQSGSQMVQTIACKTAIPLSDAVTIELRPQPNTALWIDLPQADGTIPANSEVAVPIALSWLSPSARGPYSSDILLNSNDPWQPQTRITVRLTTQAATYRLALPFLPHR